MAEKFTVVVLGGYGNFGAIISAKLATIANINVVVAGRNAAKAQTYAQQIGVSATALDSNDPDLAQHLYALKTNVLISTAGPFQGQTYQVAQAAIDAGVHYIDIADGRDFVCGITALDESAKTNNVLVVSGASSVPALSAAIIDHYKPEFAELHELDYGISTSEKTPGLATAAGVLNYCGKPLRQWHDGTWRTVYGWQDLRRYRFQSGLGTRWLANCDIPDLALFPTRYPSLRSMRFQAGLGLKLTQFGTWVLAGLVCKGFISNAASLAPGLRRIAVALEVFGNGRSGIFMQLSGVDHSGVAQQRLWELTAGNNDGPNIPCMAAVALTRKLAAGQLSLRGALPCLGLVSLDDYLTELRGLDIQITV